MEREGAGKFAQKLESCNVPKYKKGLSNALGVLSNESSDIYSFSFPILKISEYHKNQ